MTLCVTVCFGVGGCVADWRGCLLTEVARVGSVILSDGGADNGLLGFDGLEVRA